MPDGIAQRFGFTPYGAADERLLAQVLDHPAGPTAGRKGLRPGPGAEVTVGGTPATVTVAPFSAVLLDPAGGGTYHVVVPNPVELPLPTAPAAGSSRIHEVAVRILNADERPTDGVREVDVYLAEGAAAASPSAPTVPSGHLRVARLLQPSTGSTSVVDVAQRTVAAGGVLPVASQAERDAITPTWPGLAVYRTDLHHIEVYSGTTWRAYAPSLLPTPRVYETTISITDTGAGSNASVTVEFPAGRFTQPPGVQLTHRTGAARGTVSNLWVSPGVTVNSCQVNMTRTTTTPVAVLVLAVQPG